MADAALDPKDRTPTDGLLAADPARPLPGAGGGQPACVVLDRHGAPSPMMAVQVAPSMPPRARVLQALAGMTEGVLGPLAHGPGPAALPRGAPVGAPVRAQAYYVICPAPPGPALAAAPRVWPEAELLECLLRPAAQALARLAERGVTHRAIRLDNVFQAGQNQPVVLGQGWAAPPAALQPAVFEPPYSAMCLPAGRGDGAIADDVYALGVLLVALALGRPPLDGVDPVEIVRRKLDHGSYAALVGDLRLPPMIADLASGMLAEDPEHRPPPALLLDPPAARARRLAARPPKRAQAPMRVGSWSVWDARALAHAIATQPDAGLAAMRAGTIDPWLRRGLGDAALAGRVEEIMRAPVSSETEARDAFLAMRAVAVLDPLAPLCWRGLAVWPGGIGPALASSKRGDAAETGVETAASLIDLIASEAASAWAAARATRADPAPIRTEARQRRAVLNTRGPAGGARRLAYALNPLLGCESPLLGGRTVARSGDLIGALEAQAAVRTDQARTPPVDAEIAAFVAARAERANEAETAGHAVGDATPAALARMDLLATLQERGRTPAPALARWLIADTERLLANWRNAVTRNRLKERLKALADIGDLRPMLSLLQNPAALAADQRGAREAATEIARVDAELARIENGGEARAATARDLGQEIAAGLALGALALSLAVAVFG